MQLTSEMVEMLFAGVQIGILFLTPVALFCLVCAIVNKGVGG